MVPVENLLERGTVVGRFVVLGLLGRGGMGEVYAAHDPELDRKVAIKLLRGGAENESAQGRQRLVREAQAIARVSHPSVVVVYDVGTFGRRVFIAMELVEGSTLRYWAHAARRTWPEVLEVFIAAGKGLGAAHDRGLVHRDFKPDNVMITADGKIRVMDFGLVQIGGDRPPTAPGQHAPLASSPATAGTDRRQPARPRTIDLDEDDITTTRPVRIATSAIPSDLGLDDRRNLHTTWPRGDSVLRASLPSAGASLELTGSGVSLGTPAYMSPEQFRNEHTDARTDQFSFCVSLYETLYGGRPFAGQNYEDLVIAVTAGEVRPAPPTGSDVPTWIREVLLRGLKPDPRDRWPSMSALLAQLERHPALESRARFQSAAEAKLAEVWQAPRGGVPVEDPARTEMHQAFIATGKAYAAKAYEGACQILDRYARRWIDLYIEACEATHVRAEQSAEVLDLRMACLFEGLADLAALVRMFRGATAEVVEKAVSAATALGGLERCENIELLRSMVRPPADAATRARVERLRGELAEVRALCRVGRIAQGLAAIEPLEREAREIGYEPLLADVLLVYCRYFEEQGSMDEAARYSAAAALTAMACRHDETAAEAATVAGGHTSMNPTVSDLWNGIAEALLRRIGGHDLLWAWLHNNRAICLAHQGRLEEGLQHALEALALKEKVLEAGHPDIAISLGNVAIYLDDMGRSEEGIEHCRRALEIGEAGFGSDHPRTALVLSNYSEMLAREARWNEAIDAATRALAIFDRETGPEGTLVFVSLIALGVAYLGVGAIDAALVPLERADRIGDAAAPTSGYRAQAQFALARALWEQGRDRARAASLAAEARRNYEQAPETPATRRELALIADWSRGKP